MNLNFYLSGTAKSFNLDEQRFLIQPNRGDAGYDLASVEDTIIYKNTIGTVCTGVHVEIPQGYVGIIKDRSSMASKGIHVLAGVIDSSYRGEIKVVFVNLGESYLRISPLDKIAQLLVLPYFSGQIQEVSGLAELGNTPRGSRGFGSTGK